MRYSLRALLIVMLLGGPLCAWGWRLHTDWGAKAEIRRTRHELYLRALGLPPNAPLHDASEYAQLRAKLGLGPYPDAKEKAERAKYGRLLLEHLKEHP